MFWVGDWNERFLETLSALAIKHTNGAMLSIVSNVDKSVPATSWIKWREVLLVLDDTPNRYLCARRVCAVLEWKLEKSDKRDNAVQKCFRL